VVERGAVRGRAEPDRSNSGAGWYAACGSTRFTGGFSTAGPE
jgi:hypothetical protein